MTYNEAYIEWFEKPSEKYILENLGLLVDYLSSTGSPCILERIITEEDMLNRSANVNYGTDYMNINDDYAELTAVTKKVLKGLQKYTFPNVLEMSIPVSFLKYPNILESFPNLERVYITNSELLLTNQLIRNIKRKTKIKEIIVDNPAIMSQLKIPKDGIYFTYPMFLMKTDDLIIRDDGYYFGNKKETININIFKRKLDFDEIEKLCRLIPLNKSLNYVDINYLHRIDDKKVDDYIATFILDKDFNVDEFIFKVDGDNITEILDVYKKISEKRKIKKIVLMCENKTYPDLYKLRGLSKEVDLRFDYGDILDCSLDGFITMRESLDYFNKLIRNYDLSPAEKVAFVYDLIKNYKYTVDEENNFRDTFLPDIFDSKYIVCAGYVKIIKELLKENGIAATYELVKCYDDPLNYQLHARSLVRIDDDKYNIHGVYTMDSTWDSNEKLYLTTRGNVKYIRSRPTHKNRLVKEYDANSDYSHFLIPFDDYEKVFPYDTYPPLLNLDRFNNYDKLKETAKDNYDLCEKRSALILFGTIENKDLMKRYIHSKKPSLNDFVRILYNVKLAEGYTEDEAIELIDNIVEFNNYSDHNHTFFKEKIDKNLKEDEDGQEEEKEKPKVLKKEVNEIRKVMDIEEA